MIYAKNRTNSYEYLVRLDGIKNKFQGWRNQIEKNRKRFSRPERRRKYAEVIEKEKAEIAELDENFTSLVCYKCGARTKILFDDRACKTCTSLDE
ncbi:hypothetical protein FLL45_01470 [Aliikangiella marina]|uniref:Uncharacterized protein n=1 Tax=Aliikangiella marina TaxID=1712262 RepID=A0A545THJ1_9GAMM|nr:hypothetical protein [Aliikangiella marina]TQV76656.1 hypothetical protein FLL45_01470 [Aliikangiella marina]